MFIKRLLPLFLLLCFFFPFEKLQAQAPTVQFLFQTVLSGDDEVPAVATQGKGMIAVLFDSTRTKVHINGLISQLSGPVISAHLHVGKPGEIGAILIDIMPLITGRRVAGELDAPAGLLQNLLADNIYVNIHTTIHPSGEIRGNFIGETDLNFGTTLTGQQQVPPTNSTAIGLGGLHYPKGAAEMDYAFLAKGLSGPITGAALHRGAPGEIGPQIADMSTLLGSILVGLITVADVEPNFIQNLIEGKYYVVIKTAAYPDGELRGQIGFLGYFNTFSPLTGTQVVPSPGPTPGFGLSHTTHNFTLDSLTTTVLVDGITPTSASVHIAPAGMNGPLLVDLDPTPIPGVYRKTYRVGNDTLTDFVKNKLYLNFGTAAHPNGEIRGQLKTSLRHSYAFDLCGSQEVPPNDSIALGMAWSSVDQNNCYLTYRVMTDGLHGLPTFAFINEGQMGTTGNVLYSLNVATPPFIAGEFAILAAHGPLIENQGTYINILTPAFPQGEIRGQMRRGLSCPLLSGVKEPVAFDVQAYPNPVTDMLHLQFESKIGFEGLVRIHNLSGQILIEQSLEVISGSQMVKLDMKNLPAGAYQITIEKPDQRIAFLSKTIIK